MTSASRRCRTGWRSALAVALVVAVLALPAPAQAACGLIGCDDTVAAAAAGGLVALVAEIVGFAGEVIVARQLLEGKGVSREWAIYGTVLWSLNFIAATALTVMLAAYAPPYQGPPPVGTALTVAWMGVSSAGLLLNAVGLSKGPLLTPTLLPGAEGSVAPGVAMALRW